MSDVKYPQISIDLDGEDGNAFSIMGRVRKALRRSDLDFATVWKEYVIEVESGDYDHLLRTTLKWFNCDG